MIRRFVYIAALSLLFLCFRRSPDIVGENFNFADRQLKHALTVLDSIEKANAKDGKITILYPRTIKADGSLSLVAPADWTSGFFPGSLWYMYEYTKNPQWLDAAKRYTAPLEKQQFNTATHDVGFIVNDSYGNGLRITGDTSAHYKSVIVQTARSLITRFNPVVGCLRSWSFGSKWQFPVIIDNMMNLELLFNATRISGDSTFYHIAVSHANATMKNHFRDDFSSYHVIDYDPATGNVIQKNTHQGYADESSWARGQAWALYGFTTMYRETGDKKYLDHAGKIADFIFTGKNMPKDLVPYWDYNAPDIPYAPRDVSAATVTASALYELGAMGTGQSKQYIAWANTIMTNITNSYRAPLGSNYGFLLLHSTGNYPGKNEIDVPLNYADYYFLEALLRKQALGNKK